MDYCAMEAAKTQDKLTHTCIICQYKKMPNWSIVLIVFSGNNFHAKEHSHPHATCTLLIYSI